MAGSNLPDIQTLIQAGIDPKTKLPIKFGSSSNKMPELKYDAKRLFRIQDEQRAVNRFVWYNLPCNLSSQELERLLYYKGSLVFFYMKELDQFFFMPYALDGTIDFYGRYNRVHPVPMTSGKDGEEKTKEYKDKLSLLSQLKLNIQKDLILDQEDITEDLIYNSGVIIRDYTNQLEQVNQPRYLLNECLLDMEADCLAFMRTNLLLGSGVQGLRVMDADSASEVDAVANQIYQSALKGNPYIAITAKAEIQELQLTGLRQSNEYMLAMQSIDNMLLSTYGIDNTGLYEKKAHILESENAVNTSQVSLIMMDSLQQRQNFCNIVNSIWGLGIWCDIAETLSGADINGDGVTYNENSNGEHSGASNDDGGEE